MEEFYHVTEAKELSVLKKQTTWLAQLDGYQTVVQEIKGSSPCQTDTQGLKN